MAHRCMNSEDFYSIFERDRNYLIVTIETDFFEKTVSTAVKFSRFCNIESEICTRGDVYDLFRNLILAFYLFQLCERIIIIGGAEMTFLAEPHTEYRVVICDHSDILFPNRNQSDFSLD